MVGVWEQLEKRRYSVQIVKENIKPKNYLPQSRKIMKERFNAHQGHRDHDKPPRETHPYRVLIVTNNIIPYCGHQNQGQRKRQYNSV